MLPFLGIILLLPFITGDTLPTNYEYYTSDGLSSGLVADQPTYFTLNGKNFTIYSGALHYFRVPRAYWRVSLKKIRAAGLNTVETYVPWNLHEPQSGVYDFGDGGSEMEDFLHLEEFLQTAKEEDLFVLLRPGPYICAEYNFGGFPAWLLRESVGFRVHDERYLQLVERYFNILLSKVSDYQFQKNGSIIGFQLENEYGFSPEPDSAYVQALYDIYVENDIVELLMTSDPPYAGLNGTLPDLMYHAINFGSDPTNNFATLLDMQPNKPVMAMEFWTGWFDFWGGDHNTKDAATFKEAYEQILSYPGSINLYIFIGGTNFGTLNGASLVNSLTDNSGFDPVTTSYNYDSPVSEAGDYTQKYYDIKELIEKYNPVKTYTPDVPDLIPRATYPSVRIQNQLPLGDVLDYHPPYIIESENVIAMEMLDINNSSGQSYGYIVYRKENVNLENGTVLKIEGHVCDTVMVLVDGVLVSPILESLDDFDGFGYWRLKDSTLVLNSEAKLNATIDVVVEEWGRMNGGTLQQYNQTFKGLWQGDVLLNDEKVTNWKIIPLELKRNWTNSLDSWSYISSDVGPAFYYVDLQIEDEPTDMYLDMRNWTKGTVIVNGFNVGKYLRFGPQLALYVPAPFLRQGSNRIVIFEHFKAHTEVEFSTDPIYGTQK